MALRLLCESLGLVIIMEEIWKDVVGFEGLYQVSNYGKVRSLNFHREKRIRELKPMTDIGGYKVVKICKNGRIKPAKVHRLVIEAFTPNPDNKPYVDHIDTNRANNRVDNLRWCTMRENHRNPVSLKNHGLATHQNWVKGLHNKNKRIVLQYDNNNNLIKEHESIAAAARFVGCATSPIWLCINRPKKHRTAKGFVWKYKD